VSISLAARQYLTTTRLLISQQQFSHGRECDYVLWLVLCVVKVSELAGTFRDGTWLFLLEDQLDGYMLIVGGQGLTWQSFDWLIRTADRADAMCMYMPGGKCWSAYG
jgi:hypothetical protein